MRLAAALFRILFAPFRPLVLAGLRRYGRRYDYDTSYLEAVLDRAPAAFLLFSGILPIASYRSTAPASAWFAAKLVGAVSEDCGPCTQLVVNMAREAGVPGEALRAVLERDAAAMDDDVSVAVRFAEAVIGRTADEDDAREAVRARWGDGGVVDLALGIAVGRVFPMTKAGLGYAKECRLVQVGATPVVVRHATAGA
jgi:hypothetical protein